MTKQVNFAKTSGTFLAFSHGISSTIYAMDSDTVIPANGNTIRKAGVNLRKFYKVIDHETGSSELVFADGHVDALSFFGKNRTYDENHIVECSDVFVRNGDNRYQFTKLSELPDNSVFYRVLEALGYACNTPIIKVGNMANGMVRCRYLYDTIRPDSFYKGSTKATILPPEVQECLKSGKV